MAPGRVRSARGASVETLGGRTRALLEELERRGEYLPTAWAGEAARDLASGMLEGHFLSPGEGPSGLAFYSRRGERGYGHVHVEAGREAVGRASALLTALVRAWPPDLARADLGLSGLEPQDEALVGAEAVRSFGGDLLVRYSLERRLGGSSPSPPLRPPSDGSLHPIRSASLDELAALDWVAFKGSPDERLVADTVGQTRQTLSDLLAGRLGPVLDAPSSVWRDRSNVPLGFVLVAEPAPRRSVVLDLAVAPAHRRRGLGRFLLERAVAELARAGGESVRLWVTRENFPARALYAKLDFRPVLTAHIYRWVRIRTA